jgi:hypothetical protein
MDETSNLAMVPWVPVPSNSQEASTSAAATATTTTEMMDAEDTSMEVEQDGGSGGSHLAAAGEAPYYQWPQHCMAPPPQPPLPAVSYQPSPVTWSW